MMFEKVCEKLHTYTNEEFYTILVVIKGVLNNRPLTYLDEGNIEEPLTTIYLYGGHRILNPIERDGYEKHPDLDNNCK